MSRITAIKNSVYRATHVRQGSGVSRVYHNAKNASFIQAGFASIEMLFAMNFAQKHNLFGTLLVGGLTMYFTKKAVRFHNMRADLHEYYQSIVDRAKRIYKS
jgi:hypothetical protein